MHGFGGKIRMIQTTTKDRRRSNVNIKTDLRDLGWGDENQIYLAHDMDRWWALVKTVMTNRFP